MTVEEIKAQCETLSNEELYTIVHNKIRYNYTIVSVAQAELKRRKISKDEHKSLTNEQTRRSKVIVGDIHEDVLLWEKILFFFIPVPRFHTLVMRDYRRKGYVLKVKQSAFFNLAGTALFFVLLIGIGIPFSLIVAGGLWVVGFLVTYFLNQYYFKGRTIRRLAARMES
ncbi:MAG: hypothetical protein JST68_17285 [Bacteroidetes bacterium]|nr:hypothetical protein [Bacteroidota bacterium]